MGQLTPEELSEPDIIVYIPEDLNLPKEVRQVLKHYNETPLISKKTGKMVYKYLCPLTLQGN